MAFPITARYKLRFRHTDTGLDPRFTRFRRLDTLADITPQPEIMELGGGDYAFDYTWLTKTDPDVDFEVDGGPSIPTEEVRYISDLLSVRDYVVQSSGGGGGGGSSSFSVG